MKAVDTIDSFGGIDADTDDLLYDCFEDHEAFNALLDRKRFIVLGRKGAGKTAMFKRLLQKHEPTFFSLGHTFTDYPWEHHQLQQKKGVPPNQAFTAAWTYFIALTLAKIILNHDNSLPQKESDFDSMARLEKFVIDSYGSRDPDVVTIFRPSTKLRLKPYFKLDFKVLSAGVSPESVPITELPLIAHEVNENILSAALPLLNDEHEYHISFDQLDLDFDPNDPEYSRRLIGLLLAARRINIRAKELGKKLFVSIFLRSDIYALLQFEDKNKLTENDCSIIEWDRATTTHTLRELMERRFTRLLSDATDPAVSWDMLFSGKEMTNRQSQYNHILARTFSRPRDMIKFSNEILREHKRASASGSTESNDRFDNPDIIAARDQYSDYLLREIDDEIHKQVPDYKRYLEVLKLIGTFQFTLEVFEKTYNERKTSLGLVATPIDALRSLYDFSIIAYLKTGGRNAGAEYVFAYREPSVRFDERASSFRVHYGLLESLGLLKRNSADSPVE